MHPQPTRFLLSTLILSLLGSLAAPALLRAQQDAPAVDIGQLLQSLRSIRQQQADKAKTTKQTALQQVTAAAGSGERAVALWEEAIRATQIEGTGKENSQLKAWRDGEGEAFKEREVQNAVRLHLQWLALTLQRSSGVAVKEMLPAIMNYARELVADEAYMDALQDNIKHEKETAGNNAKRVQRTRDDVAAKKAHDSVLNRSLNGSVVVQYLRLNDLITAPEKWEYNPGNLDGIYKTIVLPELRRQKDQRALEYWDLKLKKEADAASKSKLAFEIEKFNTQRRPALLWNRSMELAAIGYKNRAISEMFTLIKTYPTHPEADDWINTLEQIITPPAPVPAAAPTPSAESAAAPAPAPSAPKVPGL